MSFICGLVTSAYQGACRNSFNDTASAYFLNSGLFNQIARTAKLPSHYMPQTLQPNKIFVFGAIAGATKGAVTHLVESFDRYTLNLQRSYHPFFKICALAIAFFAAYQATSFFSEQFGIPATFNHTVLMVETVDLLHQICCYSAKAPYYGSRV